MKTAAMVMNFQRTFDGMGLLKLLIILVDDGRLALVAADGGPGHLDPNFVSDLQLHALIAEPRDLAVDAAGRDDAVVHLQTIEELLHFLLLALGRQQNDEVEDPENQNERNDLQKGTTGAVQHSLS